MELDAVTSRKAGLTFQPVENPRFSVSHAERTELHEPGYLLRPEDRLPNKIIYSAGSEDEIAALFEKRKASMSAQAKRAGASPFWEAVVVLPAVEDFDSLDEYQAALDSRLMDFKERIEKENGFKVLHVTSHLDEGGYSHDGKLQRNPHAHILIDRTISPEYEKKRARHTERKRVNKRQEGATLLWSPGRAELSRVQTLYAEAMALTRGLTSKERGGRPARKHIPHKQFREMMERENLLQAEQAATVEQVVSYKEESTKYRSEESYKRGAAASDAYGFLRGFLKGSGLAKQADYQLLKVLKDDQRLREWAQLAEAGQLDAAGLQELLAGRPLAEVLERCEVFAQAPQEVARGTLAGGKTELLHLPDREAARALVAPLQRWTREHADLYLLAERNEDGKRLAFEDKGEQIAVKLDQDWGAVEAALKLAAVKWPHGFEVSGSPEFMRLAANVAASIGVEELLQSTPQTERPGKSQDDDYDYGR